MTLLLSCLRLGVDVARDPAALLAYVNDEKHTEYRKRLGHDERTDLHLHTRAVMARLKEAK